MTASQLTPQQQQHEARIEAARQRMMRAPNPDASAVAYREMRELIEAREPAAVLALESERMGRVLKDVGQ
jgi:hypothetical protein